MNLQQLKDGVEYFSGILLRPGEWEPKVTNQQFILFLVAAANAIFNRPQDFVERGEISAAAEQIVKFMAAREALDKAEVELFRIKQTYRFLKPEETARLAEDPGEAFTRALKRARTILGYYYSVNDPSSLHDYRVLARFGIFSQPAKRDQYDLKEKYWEESPAWCYDSEVLKVGLELSKNRHRFHPMEIEAPSEPKEDFDSRLEGILGRWKVSINQRGEDETPENRSTNNQAEVEQAALDNFVKNEIPTPHDMEASLKVSRETYEREQVAHLERRTQQKHMQVANPEDELARALAMSIETHKQEEERRAQPVCQGPLPSVLLEKLEKLENPGLNSRVERLFSSQEELFLADYQLRRAENKLIVEENTVLSHKAAKQEAKREKEFKQEREHKDGSDNKPERRERPIPDEPRVRLQMSEGYFQWFTKTELDDMAEAKRQNERVYQAREREERRLQNQMTDINTTTNQVTPEADNPPTYSSFPLLSERLSGMFKNLMPTGNTSPPTHVRPTPAPDQPLVQPRFKEDDEGNIDDIYDDPSSVASAPPAPPTFPAPQIPNRLALPSVPTTPPPPYHAEPRSPKSPEGRAPSGRGLFHQYSYRDKYLPHQSTPPEPPKKRKKPQTREQALREMRERREQILRERKERRERYSQGRG